MRGKLTGCAPAAITVLSFTSSKVVCLCARERGSLSDARVIRIIDLLLEDFSLESFTFGCFLQISETHTISQLTAT